MALAAPGGEPPNPFNNPGLDLPPDEPDIPPDHKKCNGCHQVKPKSEFVAKRGGREVARCATCRGHLTASKARKRSATQALLSSPPREDEPRRLIPQPQVRTPSYAQPTAASRARTQPQSILPRGINSQDTPAEAAARREQAIIRRASRNSTRW